MSKINLLDSFTYNKIAAGEVVERPASVVKELIENSIDAGASEIRIAILNGGKSVIKIRDNGIGMDLEDLKKCFLPHATSKISTFDDLTSVQTLGFRGEALPSIGAVSQCKVTTGVRDNPKGYKIKCYAGVIDDVEETCSFTGTEVQVNNLFFNTPVRAKYLKSDKAEETEISNVVTRFILGYPNIAFKYIVDDVPVYQSYGTGVEEAFLSVYGKNTIENMYYISTEKNEIKVSGFISNINYTKSNKSYQTIFVNGRCVQNATISSAIANAYGPYLMKKRYPLFSIYLTMPSEYVDVNVHPNKTEVRFLNNQIVYATVYYAISSILDGKSSGLDVIKKDYSKIFREEQEKELKEKEEEKKEENQNPEDDYVIFGVRNTHIVQDDDKYTYKPGLILNDHPIIDESKRVPTIFEEFQKQTEEIVKKEESFVKEEPFSLEENYKMQIDNKDFDESESIIVGQAFNTYIILEKGEELIFIDQHAAHERVLYDRFKKSFNDKKVEIQDLLVPLVVQFNLEESRLILTKIDLLREIGFVIEQFGYNVFKISGFPALLGNIDIEKFFNDFLKDVDDLRMNKQTDYFTEKLMMQACRSAIKGGDELNYGEIETLIDMINGDFPLKCPHGRPIAYIIKKREIEKWFKRIV